MIAQQLLRLVQELAFVLGSRTFITPPQLPQKLYGCQFTHCFIHSGQSNPTFGATYPFTALSSPFRVTILLAQFAHSIARTKELRLVRDKCIFQRVSMNGALSKLLLAG